MQFDQHSVQLDFLLTRLPGKPQERRATVQPEASIVHPTGLRHAPVIGFLSTHPTTTRQRPNPQPKPQQIQSTFQAHPHLEQSFQTQVAKLLPTHTIDDALQRAWLECTADTPKLPLQSSPARARPCLKSFWESKRHLRELSGQIDSYFGPTLWYVADSSWRALSGTLPGCLARLRPFLQTWKAHVLFRKEDKLLRQRAKASKVQQVSEIIRLAELHQPQGLQSLYRLSKRLAPKSAKKSIHFRHHDGSLMSDQEELQSLTEYFRKLYRADLRLPTAWSLGQPLHIEQGEVQSALSQLSATKALPPGHAPAALWKAAQSVLVPRVCQELNQVLDTGPLAFPEAWHSSYLTLIPKPNKPPIQPANLRPISLLPALPKLLARILAERLKPHVRDALANTPQFAYLQNRQVSDALDRAFSHCYQVRENLKSMGRSVFKLKAGQKEHLFQGGMTLSLDLSKAYDRLPSDCLLAALQNMSTPPDLIAAIMYIHDNAKLVLQRHDLMDEAPLGQGIRQGCGLSPLLWISFTLLIFQRLNQLVPPQALTGYADDFLVNWTFQHPRDFTNACAAIPKIFQQLEDLGMHIAVDKTVILLALKGRAAPSFLKQYTYRHRAERLLRTSQGASATALPIRDFHTYLGTKIGYGNFERATVRFRMSQAWTAFHRLRTLLKHSAVPIQRRVQLWSMCVWSITRYGLSSVGLDDVCTQQLVQHVHRQLRMVARSPAHISHETSAALLHRLGLQHPVDQLAQLTAKRIELSRPHVSHLQPPGVLQWWGILLASFRVNQSTPSTGSQLIEVTQLLRARCNCPTCGQTFPSHHALQVHIGKSHKQPTPTDPTKDPAPSHQRRNDERFRIRALNGLPTCRHCRRSFHGWPEFSGHFRGSACPVLHAAPTSTAPRGSSPILAKGASAPEEGIEQGQEPTPLFHRSDLQLLAKRNQVRQLATAIYNSGRLNFCPECGQWCTHPKYLSRHANKIHPHLAQHHALIQRWARSKNRASQPCEWCHAAYGTRPLTHLQSCPVLWICGHMINQHSSLADAGQLQLSDAFRHGHCPDGSPGPGGTSAGTGGTGAVQPIHAEQERASPEPVVDSPHGHTAAFDRSGTVT